MSVIKCAVVGTYCSGKTTLVNDFLRARPDCGVLEEKPRRVIAVTGNIAMRVAEVRDYLIVSTLLDEAELAQREGLFIADGGLINNIAHDLILLDAPPLRTALLDLFKYRPYDWIFWCDPNEIKLENDGSRFTDPKLRAQLHEAVGRTLEGMNFDYHVVAGSPSERLRFVLDTLGAIGPE